MKKTIKILKNSDIFKLSLFNFQEHSCLFYITDRSKAILRLWFLMSYVLVLNFVLFALYVHVHIFSLILVAEWPPIGK